MDFGIKPIASYEAIDYQGKYSKLAQDLTSLFQSVIDYRNELAGSQRIIANKVRVYVDNKKFTKKLTDIILKHSGVKYKVYFIKGELSGVFATSWLPDTAFSGPMNQYKYDKSKADTTFEKRLETFKKQFNSKDGKLNPKDATLIINNNSRLCFCIDSAFLADMYHVKIVPLAAVEIAAIVVHEIGHILSFAEQIGLVHRSVTEFTKPIRINTKSLKEAKKTIASTKGAIATAKDTKLSKKDKLKMELYEKAILSIEEAQDDMSIKHRFTLGFLALVGVFASMALVHSTRATFVSFWDTILTTSLAKETASKESDFTHALVNLVDIEFKSDEFAAMHGLALPLISALAKLNKASVLAGGSVLAKDRRDSLIKMNIILATEFVGGCSWMYMTSMYGTHTERNTAVGKALVKTLRAANLSSEIEDDIMKQYSKFKESILDIEKEAVQSYDRFGSHTRILKKIISLNGLLHFLINGKADEDYVAVMDAAESLTNTELVYQHKQLSRYI